MFATYVIRASCSVRINVFNSLSTPVLETVMLFMIRYVDVPLFVTISEGLSTEKKTYSYCYLYISVFSQYSIFPKSCNTGAIVCSCLYFRWRVKEYNLIQLVFMSFCQIIVSGQVRVQHLNMFDTCFISCSMPETQSDHIGHFRHKNPVK